MRSPHPGHPLLLAPTLLALVACADEPTRPAAAPPAVAAIATAPAPLALGADERDRLGATLRFVSEQSARALQQRDASDRVAAALGRVAERVEANDRTGVEHAITAARAAVRRYRELSTADGGADAADLEAMTLALDHAAAHALGAERAHAQPTTDTTTTTPSEERQP